MRIVKQLLLYLFLLAAFFTTGCGPSQEDYDAKKAENESLTKENESLKSEVGKLTQEIEELKFGSSRLLTMGLKHFDDGQYETAISTLETLLVKHPDAKETLEAKNVINKANLEVERLRKAENDKKEREEKERKTRIANATKKMSKDYVEIEKIT